MQTIARHLLPALLLIVCSALPASAQWSGRIHRTEAIPYDTRQAAEARDRSGAKAVLDFRPRATATDGLSVVMEQTLDIPYAWTDGTTRLHLENVGSAYTLTINGQTVAEVEDAVTPAEFIVTPFVRDGANRIAVTMRRSRTQAIDPAPAVAEPFANSYLYNQNHRSIRDFEARLVPDSLGRDFAMLDLKLLIQNGYNYDEPVEAGFDIYSPDGKLLDFNIREVTVAGRSVDTLHFTPFVYHAYDHKWEPDGKRNPPLYRVMLFTRRNGAYKEYMPLRLGFADVTFRDGRFCRFGKELTLRTAGYDTGTADRKQAAEALKSLRAKGINTLTPSAPQPAWFYELCDQLGLYVIDCAAIAAPERREDRTVGGTPSNDPSLTGAYLERVQAMYYRSRNFTCVIAYALGSPSGNGYNMYKAYEWLKSVEPNRPVIYRDADGEWNSDWNLN